jgi:hypothetical protein
MKKRTNEVSGTYNKRSQPNWVRFYEREVEKKKEETFVMSADLALAYQRWNEQKEKDENDLVKSKFKMLFRPILIDHLQRNSKPFPIEIDRSLFYKDLPPRKEETSDMFEEVVDEIMDELNNKNPESLCLFRVERCGTTDIIEIDCISKT